jgi:large subunit ribosomal protein L6
MSRVGKKAITIPKDVTITLQGQKINVKGKFGSLERELINLVNINIENQKLTVTRINDEKQTREYHGLVRSLIQNMVIGVAEKFSKVLIAEGVGYKFQVEKSKLVLNVGFTHPVEFPIPTEITIKAEGATKIEISGIDKEQIGLFASKVRDIRPPEPYKGKGILYQGEKIIRKAGKTGK